MEIDDERFELGTGETTIGRSRGCFITLRDPAASRTHLTVVVDAKGARVRDMGSSNGTFLNGNPLTDERVLQNGDRLAIGETELVYVSEHVRTVADPPPVEDSPSSTVRVSIVLLPCPGCGIDLAAGTAQCPSCGYDLRDVDVTAPVAHRAAARPPEGKPQGAGAGSPPVDRTEIAAPVPPPVLPTPPPPAAAPAAPPMPIVSTPTAPPAVPTPPSRPLGEVELSAPG
ncbi:MAG: FHA domain-containing protein, partial [Thermoanaerobaculia bacterium]|nr:FHA domain-containing protein [Thermoanaerobaculia bacterium]